MPLYLQLFRGLTPLESGLTTFPQAIGILISSDRRAAVHADRPAPADDRRPVRGRDWSSRCSRGSSCDTNLWLIRLLMLLRGFCMGFAFVPMQAASYATIDPKDNGRASSIFSVQRQVGVSLGVAILASVLAAHMSLSRVPGADEVDRGSPVCAGRSSSLSCSR